MMRRTRFLWIVAALLSTLNGGCGTSGSRPTLYPEVQFRVRPGGQSTFRVELDAGGVRHTLPQEITATSFFYFNLENAPPPYSGSFTLTDGADVSVTLVVWGQILVENVPTCGVGSTLTLPSRQCQPGPPSATPTARPSTQEVRFDVCVPSATSGMCFTGGDEGVPGLPFSGSVGDAFQTHLLNGSTPSIYFLEGARDSINALFRLAPTTGQTLVARLFINGVLTETQSGTKDVHIQRDL